MYFSRREGEEEEKMLKVAMISYHTCPLAILGGKDTGGMNVYVREVTRYLGRKGVHVDVFTRSQDEHVPHVVHELGYGNRVVRWYLPGAAAGAILGGWIFTLLSAQWVQTCVALFLISTVWQYAIMAVFYSAIHSFLEEYYWRWFVFGQLRTWCSPISAAVLSSLAFMPHHVIVLGLYFGAGSASSILFSLGVAVGGGVWCWIYHRSNSLWGPWLSHAMADAAIGCWDAKYAYFNPRPSQLDPSIKTVIGLPNFPSFTSGHSTFSAAAAVAFCAVVRMRLPVID